MAATTPQAERLRRDLRLVTAKAADDMRRVWSGLDSAQAARDALIDLLPRLVAVYGAAAGTLAADWYDEIRDQAAVRGRFRAIVAALPADPGTDGLARWGVAPLFQAEPDRASALTLLEGGLQRRILNQSRATITGSAVQDPAANGWQRVGSGECAFCSMLIGRGVVYSEAGADFASHDHCHCTAVPAWGGELAPVKPYTPSNRNTTDADRARVRAYIASH